MARSKRKAEPTKFDAEQQAAIAAFTGAHRVDACAGAGKTAALVARVKYLQQRGVPDNDILALTFTRSAAEEMRMRTGAEKEMLRTLHSWALSVVKREVTEFHPPLQSFPLLTNQFEILLPISKKLGVQYKDLTSYISNAKRMGKTPNKMREESETEMQRSFARAYDQYEYVCRRNGVLDFDSIIWELVKLFESRPAVAARHQIKFLMVDEAQDCSEMDWRLICLITKQHGNIWVVGDFAQCQPPGTQVKLQTWPVRGAGCGNGSRPSEWRETPIAAVCVGDTAQSWERRSERTYNVGQRVDAVASRHYDGPLITISTGALATRVTPTHRVWVRFNKSIEQKHAVYLMWRPDYGFRIGRCVLKRTHGGFGLTTRLKSEFAEKLWVLRVCDSRQESEAWEEIYSLRYQVPESVFVALPCTHKTQELIDLVFKEANPAGGFTALQEHGLLFEFPICQGRRGAVKFTWGDSKSVRGYIRTVAANILPGIMDIPLPGINQSAPILSASREHYSGPVHSLDIARDHTYVADGLVVGNSIYGFRGSSPQIFAAFGSLFPSARTLPMGTNYRSQAHIVDYSKKVMPEETAYLNNWKAHKPGTNQPEFRRFVNDVDEADWILDRVERRQCNLEETAILARTNAQLAIIQGLCTQRGIAYKLLGKDNFWKRPEVMALLGIVKNVTGVDDNGLKHAIKSPLPCVKFLRKDAAIEALESLQQGSVGTVPIRALLGRVYTGDSRQDEILRGLYFMLQGADALRNATPATLMQYIADRTGARELEDEDVDNAHETFIQDNIKKVVSMAGYFKTVPDLVAFANAAGRPSRKQTRLVLSTVHGFKGLEAKNVFVIGVNSGIFPHERADLQEERRLYYVAVSRPTERLLVSCAGVPSSFIEKELQQIDPDLPDPWEAFQLHG